MKKLLAIFLAITLLAVTVMTTGSFTVTAATKTDTWVLFDAKEIEDYTFNDPTQMRSQNGTSLTAMVFGMFNYAYQNYANIIKLEVPESGTLVFDSTWSAGCAVTSTYATNPTLDFAVLDKNGKVVFPTDGNIATLEQGDTDVSSIKVNLTVEVTAGDEFYFYHRATGSQVNFKDELTVHLNGTAINYGTSLCPPSKSIATQGEGGWYYMYADPATIEVLHNDPNGVTDFGGDKYVASYNAKPMIHNPEEGSYKDFWITDTENKCMVGGSIAYPSKGESIIARFTAPEDGVFHSDFFTVGLNYGFSSAWATAGHGADFFVANQDGELIVPLYDGVAELRSSGSNTGLDARDIYNNINVYHMKKGDYLDFVIVGLHDYSHGVSISGDFSFNGVACGVGGWLFLKDNEQQGDRNVQMLYATDVKVEKASTEAWLESVHLEKPFNSAPATVEAWVNIPAELPDYRVGTLISDYVSGATDGFTVSVHNYGYPRIQYKNGTVDWTVESVDLRTGEWQHIAFTVDTANNTLSFYLDGELKATTAVTGITAAASDRPAVIGNDLTDAPSTAFTGQVKKLAVWSDVRTADEILADKTKIDTSADCLLGYYPLNGVYTDKSANCNHGTVTGFNNGFYDGELVPAEDGEYTIVSMGDQQQITTCYPGALSTITQWIVNNKEKLNIKAVVNVGDYVMNSTTDGVNSNTKEWLETTGATKILTDANIPFFFTPGNHEYPRSNATSRDETHFKKYYPLADYFSQASGQDNASTVLYAYPSGDKLASAEDITADMSIANAVYHATLGGQEYLIVSLEPDARIEVLNWANVVMPKLEAEYPNAKTVVITHIYLSPDGNLLPGRSDIIYNNFVKKYESISMVLCGHNATGIATRTDYGDNGNKITSIMNDSSYEWNLTNGGEGVLQLFRFKKDGTVKVEYYSTMKEAYYQQKYQFDLNFGTEKINQYRLDFDIKQMDVNGAESRIWYTSEYNSIHLAHTPSTTYVDRNHVAIRTFVAHENGTLYVTDNPWGSIAGITVDPNDYLTEAYVKVAVTDDNGKILWPTDGKPATITDAQSCLIEFSTPVIIGDKIHFVFYGASRDGVQVLCNSFAYVGDYEGEWFGQSQITTSNYLTKNSGYSVEPATDLFNYQGPIWYYNYADSIIEPDYDEGDKLSVDLTYGVRGEGGSLEFKHNGEEVETGKITMPKGGTIYAYAYPDAGYRVKGIYANGVNVSKKDFYNLVNIYEDIDFVVEFERIPVEGDANSDGVADILDFVLMNAGEDIDKTVCDFVDPLKDNIIDSADINAFRRIMLGVGVKREITLADIMETEIDYANVDFSDKIKDGVLSIADCGAEANTLYDYGDLIRSAFRTVIDNPGTVLEFEESVYYVSPESESDCAFDFAEYDVQSLHVKGNGCTIVLLDSLWGAFDLENSRDVVFENIKFDCLVNPFIQGKVTAYDNETNLLTLKSDRPYTIFDDPRINERITSSIGVIRQKEDPTLIKTNANNYFSVEAVEKIGEQEYQFTLSESTKYLTNSKIEVGDKITINSRTVGSTFIFNIGKNSGFTLKNVTIYNSPGGGVGGGQLSGDVVLQNVRMLPHADSGNWICGSADGVHLQSNSGKVVMDNCLFANLVDDGMNLYQWEGPVNKVISSSVIEIGAMVIMPKVGDTLEIVDCVTQRIIGTSKVKELLPVEGQSINWVAQAVLEEPISDMQTGDVKDTYFYFIKDNSFVGTTIKNTTFKNIRGRGLVLCTTDTVVENCKFKNISNQIMQAWYGRGEGFEVQNLAFRNNTVENCNYLLLHADGGTTGQIDIAMANDVMEQSQYISHNNITIADNQFIDYHGCAISIKNARNVTVENNLFDLRKQNYPYKKNNAIYINVSEDITIRNNVFNDNSENLTAAIRYEGSTVENLTITDNTYACDEQHEIVKE